MYEIKLVKGFWGLKLIESLSERDVFSNLGVPEDPEEKRIRDVERNSRRTWGAVDELLAFEPRMTKEDDDDD